MALLAIGGTIVSLRIIRCILTVTVRSTLRKKIIVDVELTVEERTVAAPRPNHLCHHCTETVVAESHDMMKSELNAEGIERIDECRW